MREDDDEPSEGTPPPRYAATREPRWEQLCARLCGACCCAVLLFLALAYAAHGVVPPGSAAEGAPEFARSIVWISVAQHTPQWRAWDAAARARPPPPPLF